MCAMRTEQCVCVYVCVFVWNKIFVMWCGLNSVCVVWGWWVHVCSEV